MKHLRIAEEVALGVSQHHENIKRKKGMVSFISKTDKIFANFVKNLPVFFIDFLRAF